MLHKVTMSSVVLLTMSLVGIPAHAADSDDLDQHLGLTHENGSLPLWAEPGSQAVDQLGRLIRDMQESVMIVGHAKVGMGTAFVLSRKERLLATNAHVADMFHRAAGQMEAVAGESGRRYRIDRVWYHPGVVRRWGTDGEKLVRSVDPRDGNVHPHCADVAILHVADGPELPNALPLATPDELESLFAQPIGMLGYPAYDSAFPEPGQLPQPTYHQGVVSRLTDFGLAPSQEHARRQFVQHTASGWWGFSGSPVFLANGRVAAIHNSLRAREQQSVYVSLSHAVRVDCIWELLAHHGLDRLADAAVPVEKEKLALERFTGRDMNFEKLREASKLVREGQELVYQVNYSEAVRRCHDAMKIVPDFSDAWRLKFICHTSYLAAFGGRVGPELRLQQAEAAFESALKIVQLTPADPSAVIKLALAAANLAQTEIEVGRRKEEAHVRRARAFEVTDQMLKTVNLTPYQKAEAHSVRGVLHRAFGRLGPALADLNTAIKLQPNDVAAYRNRARVLTAMGRKADADADMKHAEELRAAQAREVAPTWDLFVSEECCFRAEFPYPPIRFIVTQKKGLEVWRFLCLDKRTTMSYVVFCMKVSDETLRERISVDRILDLFLKVGMEKGRVVEKTDLSLGQYPGTRLVVDMPDNRRALAHLYCVGPWAHLCVASGPAQQIDLHQADVKRFLESFAVKLHETSAPQSDWKEIVSPEEGFRIAFPGEPTLTTKDVRGGGKHSEYAYLNKELGVPLVFTCMDLGEAQKKQWPQVQQQLDGVRDQLIRNKKLLAEESIQRDGHPGRSLRIDSGKGHLLLVQLFVANDRIFQCVSGGSESVLGQQAKTIDIFFGSFRLLTATVRDQSFLLRDIEACFGPLGPVRQSLAYYPYDVIEFRAGIVGTKYDDEGTAHIGWAIELVSPEGKVVVKDKGENQTALGGYEDLVPFFVTLPLPASPPPGIYTFRVTVQDQLGGAETAFQREIEVKPPEFAIVAPHFSRDAEGAVPARAGGTVGQVLHVRLRCIGFDKSGGRIETAMSIQMLDSDGRPVLPKAIEAAVKEDKPEVVKEADVLTFRGQFPLERAGEFTLRIVLHDLIGNNLAKYETSLQVSAIQP
ncbi:MAG: trypsin-like peptidase domain-containing protein [Thermoguttaceae bacterium]|jgi:tetratricopeptide (TPR) repeat protein|nr:trypsin-like peptidase domain-containing protein [Thermoguttaceae bacterium]